MPELDLVEQGDQITHELDDELDQETGLDIFKVDPNFIENEKYEAVKEEVFGDDSAHEVDGDEKESGDEDDNDVVEEDQEERDARMIIQDETETNLVHLRRTIYLTIMCIVDFEEAGHKLLEIKLEPGQEVCHSFCQLYLCLIGVFCFVKQYSMIHRLETNKLRNVAKFFAHLLGTDALPWRAH